MSGWGCRYQVNEDCVLLHKPCKPGIPGCVLYKKVCFIRDVEPAAKRTKPSTSKVGKLAPAKRPSRKPK